MSQRAWYREPETFIALAALVVSVSAVVVGLYEASLQRKHDRAEVYPRLSLATYTSTSGATISLVNGGIGPAVVQHITVAVDGQPQKDWSAVVGKLIGRDPGQFPNSTVADQSVKAGDRFQLTAIPVRDMPEHFWKSVGRISIHICYQSLFDEAWTLDVESLGSTPQMRHPAKSCPPQPPDAAF